jgi:tRNA1Val (adenine37-N6)-methyltransferase
MFQFKQFSVDQSGCAMKINTDGVLLGAMAGGDNPNFILDLGTGTGVISLMLAQRFTDAHVDAVEIDEIAAKTAENNFENSPFAERLKVYALSFENYFQQHPQRKYDLIVSNPPFYLNSLKSPGAQKTLAKHTDVDFFERLIKSVTEHLAENGSCWLILPVDTGDIIIKLASVQNLYPQKLISVYSYDHSAAHRVIICLGFNSSFTETVKFTIYESDGVYTDQYRALLQPYFLAF